MTIGLTQQEHIVQHGVQHEDWGGSGAYRSGIGDWVGVGVAVKRLAAKNCRFKQYF